MASGQTTAAGQARLALALSFLNVSPWGGRHPAGDLRLPGPGAGPVRRLHLRAVRRTAHCDCASSSRVATRSRRRPAARARARSGSNFAQILHRSSYYPEVKALYDAAGLSLTGDIEDLQRNATLRPDRAASRWLARTSVPTGRLQVPELDIHTISDPLIPIQQERWYAELVRPGGRRVGSVRRLSPLRVTATSPRRS